MLQWLDDFLLHAKTETDLLDHVETFFSICREKDLKVHAQKVKIFCRSATFCGRRIDSTGLRYDPRHLSTLESMLRPETAAELQQFLCAAGWMRGALPNFAT